MKNFKINAFFLGIFILLSTCCCFLIGGESNLELEHSNASMISETYDNSSQNIRYNESGPQNYITHGGNIPFSLFTSSSNTNNTTNPNYRITEYHPNFIETYDENKESCTYIIDPKTIPYILLSSNKSKKPESKLNEFYDLTLFLKFNDVPGRIEDFGKVATLNTLTPTAFIENNSSTKPIQLKADAKSVENNASYTFELNLLDLSLNSQDQGLVPKCPILSSNETEGSGDAQGEKEPNYLGGKKDNNDISQRTGLYTIKLAYVYSKTAGHKSSKCIFEISFYVIDYGTYINDDRPKALEFENVDLLTPFTEDGQVDAEKQYLDNYYIYNYNYIDTPIVKFDATKFALNFTYTVKTIKFDFIYKDFIPNPNSTIGAENGTLIIHCPKNNLDYYIDTYDDLNTGNSYIAHFNLKSFQNFLFNNSDKFKTFTYQGKYHFQMGIIVKNKSTTIDTIYTVLDNNLFNEDVVRNLNDQHLIIFGYDLRYKDNDKTSPTYKKYFPLENDYTHTTFLANNIITERKPFKELKPEEEIKPGENKYVANGNLFNLADLIATTNQLPLEFNSFGSLNSDGKAEAKMLKYGDDSKDIENILFSLNTAATQKEVADLFKETKEIYQQNSTISGDNGIWLMQLKYFVKINIMTSKIVDGNEVKLEEVVSIPGTQYVLFQINNNIQDLQIQAIDDNYLYTFNNYTNQNVRIGMEYKKNYFYAPTKVTYTISSTFDDVLSAEGTLQLKKDPKTTKPVIYNFNGKQYNYFCIDQSLNYTFANTGEYKIKIENVVDSSYRKKIFTIDKSQFNKLLVSEAIKSDILNTYIKGNEIQSHNGVYITNTPFTIGWQEKNSGASSYSFICRMKLKENKTHGTSLIKQQNNEYWLTNNYEFDNVIINAETNYLNSSTDTEGELKGNQFFKEDGLYFFYIYDKAGNSTSLVILLDSTKTGYAQGSWGGDDLDPVWINSFDDSNRNSNIINTNTVLYFGTHKALRMPNLSEIQPVHINNINYTGIYDLSTGDLLNLPTSGINFDFYKDLLLKDKNFIKQSDNKDLIGETAIGTHFLVLPNLAVSYSTTKMDDSLGGNSSGILDPKHKVLLYTASIPDKIEDNIKYFKGESLYVFKVLNANNVETTRIVEMNFDKIKGSFEAYNNANDEHHVLNNMGTNLDILKFSYVKSDTNPCYSIMDLSYEYFPFELNPNKYNDITKSFYPFSQKAEPGKLHPIQDPTIPNKFVADKINLSYGDGNNSGKTKAGKYIITRTLRGGDYNLVDGKFVKVTTSDNNGFYGGKYQQKDTGKTDADGKPIYEYHNLFEIDNIIRKYVIYVDHNNIISKTFLGTENEKIKEVGEHISIDLGVRENNKNNKWTFKDFYRNNSPNHKLITNKVPVQINIPRSKYFYPVNKEYVFCYNNFSKLDVSIKYTAPDATLPIIYSANSFNTLTGMNTSSELVSIENPEGDLIFSKNGLYEITINDHTGYIDYVDGNMNVNPISYTFQFTIDYASPECEIYSNKYNQSIKGFEQILLTNEDNSNNFALNTLAKNVVQGETIEDNNILVNWEDPSSPYLSRVNQILVEKITKETSDYFLINLLKCDLSKNIGKDLLNITGRVPFLLSLNLQYYDETKPFDTFDNQNYYRYKYSLSLSLKDEAIYFITFYYDKNAPQTSFSSSRYKVTIDRTKPNENIDKLLYSDTFLDKYYRSQIPNNFKEEQLNLNNFTELPSSLTYPFNINKSFTLANTHNDTMPYFYVRSYDYNTSYPSLTPDLEGVPFFENSSLFSKYKRFSETGKINGVIQMGPGEVWHEIQYQNVPLYSLIEKTLGNKPSGFYEIIEKDYSGNYRTYTVYFLADNRNDFEILNFSGIDSNLKALNTEENNHYTEDSIVSSQRNLTAFMSFKISNIYSELGWAKIKLSSSTLHSTYSEEITLKPKTQNLTETLLEKINNYLSTKIDTVFTITLSSSNLITYRNLIIVCNKAEAKLNIPEIIEINNYYSLYLPVISDEALLYLREFELLKFNKQKSEWESVLIDGKEIKYTDENEVKAANPIKGIKKGIYKAIYKDNFNLEKYEYDLYIGEYQINNFNEEYKFEYNTDFSPLYDSENNIYYTGGRIDVTYEGNIYKVKVNNVLISGTDKEILTPHLSSYNCKTFSLTSNFLNQTDAEKIQGGESKYTIEYYNLTDNQLSKKIDFIIYDKLPSIYLTNSKDPNDKVFSANSEDSLYQITNAVVNVNWDKLTGSSFPKLNENDQNSIISVNKYIKDENGKYVSRTEISKNSTISEEGTYKLVLENKLLGNNRTIYFKISFKDASLYNVHVKENDKIIEIFPSQWEQLDFSLNNKQLDPTTAVEGERQPLIKSLFDALKILRQRSNSLNDKVELDKTEYEILLESFGYKNNIFNVENIGIANVRNIPHYYSKNKPFVTYNANMELKVIEFCFKNDQLDLSEGIDSPNVYFKDEQSKNPTPEQNDPNYWTTIYLVYNLTGPIKIELFAVTKVPETTSLLQDNIYYNGEAIDLISNYNKVVLTNKEVPNEIINLSWNALSTNKESTSWFNQGNSILVRDRYGVNDKFHDLKINNNNTENSTLINGAGQHDLQFYDLAGNIHIFQSEGSFRPKQFSLYYLNKVIYNIRYNDTDLNPIQYGVFNDKLDLVIDKINNDFNLNSYQLSVYCNGKLLNLKNGDYSIAEELNGEQVLSFAKPGKYTVYIDAKYNNSNLKTAVYNFTILSTTAAKLAFEFPEISGYRITKVERDKNDITQNFMVDNEIKSLFISSTESKSGNGHYTVTLQYGPYVDDILTFSFLISNFTPTVSCDVAPGETTKGDIHLSYNPSFIYNQLGDCYLDILAYNNDTKRYYVYDRIAINKDSLSTSSYTLSESNSYCIQINTLNGNTVSSFIVNKVEPLNAFAIIIIVISSIAAIVLIIVIVKLRTRIKVK